MIRPVHITQPYASQRCRHCDTQLGAPTLDLGYAPPSNAYVTTQNLSKPEVTYPLRVRVCPSCFLLQTEDFTEADALFDRDYAYFSSTSQSWLDHAKTYTDMITDRLSLGAKSFVVELASNDGYLLKNFVAKGIPCLGIEPTASTAEASKGLGVPTRQEFFGSDLGAELAHFGQSADLVIGNNVFAHVPDINDFTKGMAAILKPDGVITLEFPHLLQLLKHNQFDTIYHEHFSYLSLIAVKRIFLAQGLRIFDVEELPTHGGSLRIYGCLQDAHHSEGPAVAEVLASERKAQLDQMTTYQEMQARAEAIKHQLLEFLLEVKSKGQSIAAYGAAAKGNTLLNFSGVGPDLLPYVVDAAPSKQGKFLPASHIPILGPDVLRQERPDYVLILPWNIAEEVCTQLSYLSDSGTQFVIAIPGLKFL